MTGQPQKVPSAAGRCRLVQRQLRERNLPAVLVTGLDTPALQASPQAVIEIAQRAVEIGDHRWTAVAAAGHAPREQLHAGGAFTQSGQTPINRIGRWDEALRAFDETLGTLDGEEA